MKFLLSLLLIAAAAMAGYHFEPELRGFLTGTSSSPAGTEPGGQSPAPVVINLADYAPEQLPKQIQIKPGATISLEGSGMKMKFESASKVNLIRIEGSRIIFNAGAGNASVALEDTDLVQQLMSMPKQTVAPAPIASVSEPEPAMPPVAASPEAPPAPEPPPAVPEPQPLPAGDSVMSGDSVESASETPAAPEPPTGAAPTVMTPVIEAMQASLKNDELTEIKFDQVVGWTTGPEEIVEGSTYQVGLVSCETTTMFGSKVLQAKAYVQDNKVIRWVWPKSGAEIK